MKENFSVRLLLIPVLYALVILGCSKQTNSPVTPPVTDTTGSSGTNNLQPADNIKFFDSMFFTAIRWYDSDAKQYFSTFDTTFKQPMNYEDLTNAQLKNVDLLFFFDVSWGQDEAEGFLDPVTASVERKELYDDEGKNYYYYPWLASSVETQFYLTRLSEQQLDSAKNYKGFLNKYFNDTDLVHLTHPTDKLFPYGSGTGCRLAVYDSAWSMDGQLKRRMIIGFKNKISQKRGLIYIRNDQESTLWQTPIYHFGVKVDIVKEK